MDYIQKFLHFIPLFHVRRKPGRLHQAETFLSHKGILERCGATAVDGDLVFHPQLD